MITTLACLAFGLAHVADPDPAAELDRAEAAFHAASALHYYGTYTRTELEPTATGPDTFTVSGTVWLERLPDDPLIGWKIATISSTAYAPEPFMIRATYDGEQVSIAHPTMSKVATYDPTPPYLSIVTEFQRARILLPYIAMQSTGGNTEHPITGELFDGTTATLLPDETVDGLPCRVLRIVFTPKDGPSAITSSQTTMWIADDGFLRKMEKDWGFGGKQIVEQWSFAGLVVTSDLADQLFEPWIGPGWRHQHTDAEGHTHLLSEPETKPTPSTTPPSDPPAKLHLGGRIPEISLTMPDGTTRSLLDQRSGPLLLDFWGTWCGPCIVALPEMKRLSETFGSRGLTVLGVSVNEPKSADPQEFLRHRGVRYDTAVHGEAAAKALGVQGYPTILLIDADGTLLGRWMGYSTEQSAEIERAIEQAIK